MSEKLTVLIPCKNERKNIRLCIESLRDLADEILVADSGSTDGTLEIVRGLSGCRVIQREYVDHGNFVNWALEHASHSWVLIVDADERLTPELAAEVRRVLAGPEEDVDGYWVSFRCFFLGHPVRFSRWNTDAIRLVRRDRCRHRPCLVHPEFDVPRGRTRKLKGKLLHYSYWSYDEYLSKYQNYTRWVAQERWAKGTRASWSSLLIRPMLRFFHLYVIRLGFFDGLPGLQVCMLTAFFNTFMKQGRLWEMEHALTQPDPEATRVYPFPPRDEPSIAGQSAGRHAAA
jgi:glycosyltransferase involved in cell wall biosynthesis